MCKITLGSKWVGLWGMASDEKAIYRSKGKTW